MAIFIYLFIVTAVALILIAVSSFPKFSARKIQLPQKDTEQVRKLKVSSSYLAYLFPFSQKLLAKFKLDVKIKNKLDTAHLKLTAPEFINLKLALMVFLGILTPFVFGRLDLIVLAVAVGLGYILPDLWVKRKIAQRKFAIARVLPETIDLLGLCIEAGLDFVTAARWIIEKKVYTDPMIEELTFALEEIKWGKPHAQALKDMGKRLNIPEVSSFVQTLIQAERMGTPVTEAFSILSEDARLQRFRRGERFAMQAPIKILIPLVFCIFPVIAIVVSGPIFLQFMQGGFKF